MSLTLSAAILKTTKHTSLGGLRATVDNRRHAGDDAEYAVDTTRLDDAGLQELAAAAEKHGDGKAARAIEAIRLARSGDFAKAVPSFKAFAGILHELLTTDIIDGWIYVVGQDGNYYPELVTDIHLDAGISGRGKAYPTVTIKTSYYGRTETGYRETFGSARGSHVFSAQEVVKRRVGDALAAAGFYKETPALKAEYEASMRRYAAEVAPAFGEQFRVSGIPYAYEEDNYKRRTAELHRRRVIHDMDESSYGTKAAFVESRLFDDDPAAIPDHPLLRVFDLATHEFLWVHSDQMEPYQYDLTLSDKLILPKTHRDLLDVLTTNLDAFTADIIEGKSAGNVILAKGIPGVGKTLTAEVYSELIKRPLYSIHSGTIGTTAEDIEKSLREVFMRGKRWRCVLLLDEADVFVVKRGNNLEQNAIVAEFLRTLEYFDGLLFMTTNRPDDIDEAIISRCAAIIDYVPPGPKDSAAIWAVMAHQYEAKLDQPLIDQLVTLFPDIAPRDIKMMFRLALRVANSRSEALSLDTFRQCAMFRAIRMADSDAGA
ncbi:AAA family ATPase [Xanthomonas vasicola]|nr:ATP-binding protein [Xanthomonas vasicola]MBV6747166.1 ATP-binding protein [Xanthomonas vasicola pv. vasculorum NCPPB 890]MBV6892763.1 ATP-binding protein [Xanthomonas vasicola pv. vasculorum]MDO6948448.1 ATP-binding protein [Xanthomonas vasicola]MDO6960514.1 ATP-binding protein [Xanthomonas vasicola]